jgi:RHS repeat-associated protein
VGGEGRQIDITYSGDAVSSITDGTRQWTYAYGTAAAGRGTLTTVNQGTPAQPNLQTWTIAFAGFTNAEIINSPVVPSGEEIRSCLYLQTPDNYLTTPVGTITHPSGAVGTFTVSIVEHSRSNVPAACENVMTPVGLPPGTANDRNDDSNRWPISYHAFSLKTKTISGNGMTPATWTYSYASDQSVFLQPGKTWQNPTCNNGPVLDCMQPVCLSDTCAGTARTTVLGPNGKWTRYTYGNSYRYDEGKLKKVETGSSATNILRTTTHQYDLSLTNQTYLAQWGYGSQDNGDSFQDEFHRPLLRTDIVQQGVTFTNHRTSFDTWARPTTVTRYSTLGSRTDTTVYENNVAAWVLGQTKKVTNTNLNQVLSYTEYDAVTALPLRIYWPHLDGQTPVVQQTLTYNANGTLATVKDGRNYVTTLSNWYRGVPRAIAYPDTTSHAAQVNAVGYITQVTDQNGFATDYGYDGLGRLASITYPTGDSVAWNQTTLSFAKTTATELGFPAGTWRQQVQTGNGIRRTYFDAMWRPKLSHEYDSAAQAATQRFSSWAYDASGRTIFAAYPLAAATSTASFTEGVWTEYDTLDRVTSVTQDSELAAPYDTLTTLTEYLANFEIRTTNPRAKATTTRFMAWDEPDTSMPKEILAPAGMTTTITRDPIGRSTHVGRSGTWAGVAIGTTRSYRYNTRGQLERSTGQEERNAYFDYDAAGNLQHRYHCNLYLDTDCGWTTGGARPTDRTTMTYDPMNRVTLVDYPAGTDDIATTYHPDGAMATVSTGSSTLEYDYNRRRLLTTERWIWGASTWIFGHGYNANGHEATLTYRDGHQVSFAPNALGQATQAGTYATGASYFPNGALKQFTYGNGIVHTLTQNARQLPERSRDMFGATAILDDTYDYDQNGNVAGISDALSGQPGNRDMTYDDLDRLVGVTAGSAQGGNAVFAYDVLDNIRQLDQGTRTVRHTYDTVNRLDTIKNAAGTTLSSYDFDSRGNLTTRTTGAVTDTFTFDKANRLRSASIGGVASSYSYDGLGRRVRMQDGTAITHFFYGQGGQLLYTSEGATTLRYNHIHLAGSLVAKRILPAAGGTASIRYQHTDALGSPVAETSETGVLTRRERMTAYGEPADGTWQAGPGFTGHQMDATSRLVYMQQRYYDPVSGRFLSADPMASNMQNGWNFSRYNYAANNPYRFTDPDGRRITNLACGMVCRKQREAIESDRLKVEEEQRKRRLDTIDETDERGAKGSQRLIRRWVLSTPSEAGGHIVQEVTVTVTATTPEGSQLSQTTTQWEAWPVRPGTNAPDVGTDTFALTSIPDRYARIQMKVTAAARFYEGLTTLPATFKVGQIDSSGQIPSSRINPKLSIDGATDPLRIEHTITWP